MSIARASAYLLLLVPLSLQLAVTVVHAFASANSYSPGVYSKALGPQSTMASLVEFKILAHQRSEKDIAVDIFRDCASSHTSDHGWKVLPDPGQASTRF